MWTRLVTNSCQQWRKQGQVDVVSVAHAMVFTRGLWANTRCATWRAVARWYRERVTGGGGERGGEEDGGEGGWGRRGEEGEREEGEEEELFIDMRHCYKYHFATKALVVLLHRKTFCFFLAHSATLEWSQLLARLITHTMDYTWL